MAIQTAHAFEKHDHSVSDNQITFNLYENETDCSVFHFKINNNSIEFSTECSVVINNTIEEKIYTFEGSNYAVKPLLKSSRGPPYLMF